MRAGAEPCGADVDRIWPRPGKIENARIRRCRCICSSGLKDDECSENGRLYPRGACQRSRCCRSERVSRQSGRERVESPFVRLAAGRGVYGSLGIRELVDLGAYLRSQGGVELVADFTGAMPSCRRLIGERRTKV